MSQRSRLRASTCEVEHSDGSMVRAIEGDTGGSLDLAAAVRGDMDAFGRFYDENIHAVLKYFHSRTACPDTAADLAAETFAAALGSLHRYRAADGSGRQWLFGIARHQLTRYWRWRRVDSRARERLGVASNISLDDLSYQRIDELVDFAPIRRELQHGLARLSPRLLAAVTLRIDEELPYAEVADRLGCSESAARARVSRALRKVEADLEATT